MFKEVKDRLVTILGTITGTSQPLKATFGYMNPSPELYPCALVRVQGASQEIRLDTASNLLTMEFVVRVLIREKNTPPAEDQRLTLMTAVTAVFRSAANVDTLAGLVEKFDIISITTIDINEDQPAFGFDLVLQASKIRTIS